MLNQLETNDDIKAVRRNSPKLLLGFRRCDVERVETKVFPREVIVRKLDRVGRHVDAHDPSSLMSEQDGTVSGPAADIEHGLVVAEHGSQLVPTPVLEFQQLEAALPGYETFAGVFHRSAGPHHGHRVL